MSIISQIEDVLIKAGRANVDRTTLRLTPSQWRTVLEGRSFLDQPDNQFQHPRRFLGVPVQIIPDESFR